MYQLTKSGILRMVDNAHIPTDPSNRDYGDYLKWCDKGNVAAPEPGPTLAEQKTSAIAAVQSRLDGMAQAWGYDSMLSLCTYATSKIPRFAAEGKIGANFRDDTWAVVDKRQHDVMSEAELMAVLPPIPDRPKA